MITRWWLLAAPDLPRLGGGGVEGGDGDGQVRLQRRQGPRGAAQAEVQGRSVERLHPSVCRWEGAGGAGGFLFSQLTDLQDRILFLSARYTWHSMAK